jgi:hypothetical protein
VLIKRLLRASLLPTVYLQCVIVAALLWIAFIYHADHLELAIAVLIQVAALLFAPAVVVATLSGRPLPPWMVGLITGLSFSIVGISTGISALAGWSSSISVAIPVSALAILLLFLCRLGLFRWRTLRERPHPFLPN